MCLECIRRAKYGLFTNNTPRIMTADATDKEVRELIRMNPMTAHVIFEEDYKKCFEVYKEIYNNEENPAEELAKFIPQLRILLDIFLICYADGRCDPTS